MRRVTTSLIGLLIAAPLFAQEPTTAPREHVVREGDTLWDLAGQYFNDPFQWPAIYEANTHVIANPHLILPQERLVIPGLTGGPAGAAVAAANAAAGQATTQEAPRPNRTLFYRPPPVRPQDGEATVLSEPVNTNVPVAIGEFMSAPYLMDPAELDVRGVFMRAIRDGIAGPGPGISAHPQDRVYAGYGGGVRPSVGDRLVILHVGDDVDGAAPGERVLHPRGIMTVEGLGRDVMEGRMETQFGPVYPEQLLVPVTLFPDFRVESAEPVEGDDDLRAEILAFVEDHPLHGPGDLAFLSVGARDGVSEGDVFEAFLPRREAEMGDDLADDLEDDEVAENVAGDIAQIADVDVLPPEVVAELRVLRVTDAYATVRVDQVFAARLIQGLPVMRVRRIP